MHGVSAVAAELMRTIKLGQLHTATRQLKQTHILIEHGEPIPSRDAGAVVPARRALLPTLRYAAQAARQDRNVSRHHVAIRREATIILLMTDDPPAVI